MSKQASEEENKELNRVEERLKELSKCELFLDNIFIKDKTARQILVSAYNKLERQQKEIKDWFEIAVNILRATDDFGNITIGDIPKYIENQQKEIKKEKSRIMELVELLDKQENEIKFLKGELEIQEGCSISKDKIREIIEHYNNELEHIKNGEEFENEKPMYYWGKVALENLLEDN